MEARDICQNKILGQFSFHMQHSSPQGFVQNTQFHHRTRIAEQHTLLFREDSSEYVILQWICRKIDFVDLLSFASMPFLAAKTFRARVKLILIDSKVEGLCTQCKHG